MAAPSGYEIKVKIDGLLNSEKLKLGYHFGNKQYLKDSTLVEPNGWAIFKGEEPLDGGIYFVILPDQAGYFEFLVQEQQFSLETEKTDLVGKMKVKGSPENELFFENMRWNQKQSTRLKELNEALKNATSDKDKNKLQKQIDQINKEAKERIVKFKKEKPDMLFTKIITAGNDPELPESVDAESKQAVLSFYKEHYFDTYDFSDSRLARTTILNKKIAHYTNKLIVQQADSVSKACDKIIALAKADTNHYKIVVTSLLNNYAKPKIMGLDAVYVHLAENYYNEKDAWWVKSADLFRIQERAKDMKPSLLGQKARSFTLQDSKGKFHKLSEVKSKYTIIYFWDPDCGHCKKTTPKLVDFVKGNEDLDATIFTITTEHEEDKWRKYLEKNPDMESHFYNLADFKFRSRFRQDFDITGTPRIFVLDEDKIIIAKKIQPNQIRPIIDRHEKSKKK